MKTPPDGSPALTSGPRARPRLTRTATAIFAVAALVTSLVACSGSSGSSTSSSASSGATSGTSSAASATSGASSSAASGSFGATEDTALHKALPAKYIKSGVKVAAFNDWPPDEFVDNGALVGWSMDLAKALSVELGVKFSYTGTSFDAVLPGLQNGRFDAGFASFAATPDRLKVLDFIPERSDGSAYASLKSNNITITTPADLCGHSIAVLTGAFDFQYLQTANTKVCKTAGKPAITIKQFTTQSAAQLAVTSGRVQMVAAGSATLGYLAKQDPKITVSSLVVDAQYNCIGVRKGDPLGQSLANGMQKLITAGIYQKIMDKWGVGNLRPVTKGLLITANDPNPK